MRKDRGSTRAAGKTGEDIASCFLKAQGYEIIERNYYAGHCELDIVAQEKDGAVVFVEVKMRTNLSSSSRYGRPAAAVGREKQRHLIAAAEQYIRTHPDICDGKPVRIDVIEVYAPDDSATPDITHLRNAVIVKPGYNK